MYEILSVIFIVFGVLQIILFFKMWSMTNDVRTILDVLNSKDSREVRLPKKAYVKNMNNEEVQVVGMKNGKVLCKRRFSQSSPNSTYDSLIDINDLTFGD